MAKRVNGRKLLVWLKQWVGEGEQQTVNSEMVLEGLSV